MVPSVATGQWDVRSPSASGYYEIPTLRNKPTKKGKTMAKATWKLVAKNADNEYNLNPKTGKYEDKQVDYVEEFDSFDNALRGFLEWVNDLKDDRYNEFGEKVSLVYIPASKKNKEK